MSKELVGKRGIWLMMSREYREFDNFSVPRSTERYKGIRLEAGNTKIMKRILIRNEVEIYILCDCIPRLMK